MFSDIRWECNTSPSPLGDGFSRIRSRTFSQFGCGRFSLLPDSMVVTFYFHLHSRLVPPLFPHFHALARHVFLKLGAGAQQRSRRALDWGCGFYSNRRVVSPSGSLLPQIPLQTVHTPKEITCYVRPAELIWSGLKKGGAAYG